MPLKRILSENRNFDPAAIAILLGAFDAVAAEVRLRTPAEGKEQPTSSSALRWGDRTSMAKSSAQRLSLKCKNKAGRPPRLRGRSLSGRSDRPPHRPSKVGASREAMEQMRSDLVSLTA
jgi:hypothetical protein